MKKSMLLMTATIIVLLSFCTNAKATKNELWVFTAESCGIVISSTQVDEDVFIIRVSVDGNSENDGFIARKSPIEIGTLVRIKNVYAGEIHLILLEKCTAGGAK